MAGYRAAGHACRHRHRAGPRGGRLRCCTPAHAYLFANRRANRMKVLVHDGIGVWLAARRLNSGKFVWPREGVASAGSVAHSSMHWCWACPGSTWAMVASLPCSESDRRHAACQSVLTRQYPSKLMFSGKGYYAVFSPASTA
ncbi:IS66 family insertion sequence element accessory protein TnpB [Hydrogenophaga sp.]|uniref:IS66 family insertion sequence element accessory protein TnpB n=1 Tax=Hydrogenophaga sp. TaxID=1904254 RepID=UPI003458331B